MKQERIESLAAGVSGVGILLLCLLGGYAEFTRQGISLESQLGTHGGASSAASSADLAGVIRHIVVCFFFTGVVDIFVAIALLAFCVSRLAMPSDNLVAIVVAVLAAVFRVAYASVILSCLNGLVQVPKLLAVPHGSAAIPEVSKLMVMQQWESFRVGFNGVALGLFGFHLALLAVPLASSSSSCFGRIVLPISLVVAGAGYTGDALGIFLQDRTFGLTENGCFVGELLMMGWMLVTWLSSVWRGDTHASAPLAGDEPPPE